MTLQELVDELLILIPGNGQFMVVIQGESVFLGEAGAVRIEDGKVVIDSVI